MNTFIYNNVSGLNVNILKALHKDVRYVVETPLYIFIIAKESSCTESLQLTQYDALRLAAKHMPTGICKFYHMREPKTIKCGNVKYTHYEKNISSIVMINNDKQRYVIYGNGANMQYYLSLEDIGEYEPLRNIISICYQKKSPDETFCDFYPNVHSTLILRGYNEHTMSAGVMLQLHSLINEGIISIGNTVYTHWNGAIMIIAKELPKKLNFKNSMEISGSTYDYRTEKEETLVDILDGSDIDIFNIGDKCPALADAAIIAELSY